MNLVFLISRSIQVLVCNFILIWKLPLLKLFTNYSSKSKNVVWINVFGIKYFMNAIIWDTAIINGLVDNGKSFKIFFGRKIGRLYNKNIFYHINMSIDVNRFNNYVQSIYGIIYQLESQGNTLFPSSKEVLHWENKEYMHDEFKRLNIKSPLSYTIKKVDDLNDINLEYPILLKYVHSYHSKGIYKINSINEAKSFLIDYYKTNPNSIFIAQELVNIRKDMRIIFVGSEIVLHYWRNNPSKEWRPTSTSYDSKVDFITFPDRWRSHITEQFLKLDISTGAFDLAFSDDDLNNEPLFLEVSSAYSPNPIIDTSNMKSSYGELRRKLWNRFDYLYINLIYKIVKKRVSLFFLNVDDL